MTKIKEVDSIEEAEAFILPMMSENKWAITVLQGENGKFLIKWIEHKFYTDQSGVQQYDELWISKDGNLTLVQDLNLEHAHNIIRMFLKEERLAKETLNTMYDQVTKPSPLDSFEKDYNDGGLTIPEKRTLH